MFGIFLLFRLMDNKNHNQLKDEKERAYLYDLYVVPQWREAFDRIADEEIKLPEEGKFLDAGCGTGSYAIDLAIRGGAKVEVVGVDTNAERLALARSKAKVKKLDRITFQQGSLPALEIGDREFDFVIGDASMLPTSEMEKAFAEMARVAKPEATIGLKLTTRGSFDEFFSIYWESLYNLDLIGYTPQLESMITERLTVTDAETLATIAGWKQVRSATQKERFDFADANAFFNSPLIDTFFLDDWLAILPDPQIRQRVREQMGKIIDEERHAMDFDVSIKATLLIGQK